MTVTPEEVCRDSPINAFWNNATATPDQSVINSISLSPLLAFVIAGAIASVFNIICILIFVTKKVMGFLDNKLTSVLSKIFFQYWI